MIALFAVVWILCGVLAFGRVTQIFYTRWREQYDADSEYGLWTAKESRRELRQFAAVMSLFGPLALIITRLSPRDRAVHGLLYRLPPLADKE